MNIYEREMRYLSVEAHHLLDFLSELKQDQKSITLIPNLRYGLVAVSPIIPALKQQGYNICPSRVGSSEAHNSPLIIGKQPLFPLELITKDQHHFVVVDGTRNTGGGCREYHKYPDSHQGYLNYTIVLNDCITSNDAKFYAPLLGVSIEHINTLRDTAQYWAHKSCLEEQLEGKNIDAPYSFRYWNPAGLTLALLNHGIGCVKETESFKFDKKHPLMTPTVFFVNAVMPLKYHSVKNQSLWGEHASAYFDDNGQVGNPQFSFDQNGIYIFSGLGKRVEQIYEEIYGGNKYECR